MLQMLAARPTKATISCEEVQETFLAPSTEASTQEQGMQAAQMRERFRQAARRLANQGQIDVVQNGQVVEPSFAKGVMQLRLREGATIPE